MNFGVNFSWAFVPIYHLCIYLFIYCRIQNSEHCAVDSTLCKSCVTWLCRTPPIYDGWWFSMKKYLRQIGVIITNENEIADLGFCFDEKSNLINNISPKNISAVWHNFGECIMWNIYLLPRFCQRSSNYTLLLTKIVQFLVTIMSNSMLKLMEWNEDDGKKCQRWRNKDVLKNDKKF